MVALRLKSNLLCLAALILAIPVAALAIGSGGGTSGGGGGSPTGAAGGDLTGNYPSPTVSSYNNGTAFGTAASRDTGTSGTKVPLLNGNLTWGSTNQWSSTSTFNGAVVLNSTISGYTLTPGTATIAFSNSLTFAGTDGSTLNIGAGGTLGSAAFINTGTSGATIGLLNGANTWGATQTFTTSILGITSGTSMALGGATIGSDALGVTGTTTLGGNTVVSGGSFGLSGNISAPAWTTSGIRYKNVAGTLTDTTSSGTVAAAYTDKWGGNTIAASSATTFTNYYTAYFAEPTAGANVAFTNKHAIGADSIAILSGGLRLQGATSGTSILNAPATGGGTATLFGGSDTIAGIGTAQTWTAIQTYGSGLLKLNGATSGTSILNAPATGGGTATLFAGSDTIAGIGTVQTWTAAQTISAALTANNVTVTSSTIPANGIYLSSANNVGIASNSALRFTVSGSGIISNTGSGGRFDAAATSGTVPVFIPNKGDTTTGMGAQASGNVSLIAAATEMMRVTSTLITLPTIGSDATHTDSAICQDTTTHALYSGSGTLGVCLGTSSARYKNAIHLIPDGALPKVMELTPKSYVYKKGYGDPKRRDYWLVAEDVAKVLPECVPLDKGHKPTSVDQVCIETFMLKAIQEQQHLIAGLTQRLAHLEHTRH